MVSLACVGFCMCGQWGFCLESVCVAGVQVLYGGGMGWGCVSVLLSVGTCKSV